MSAQRYFKVFLTSALALAALPTHATDRLHAGQWEMTSVTNGRARTHSDCLKPAYADAMNGDANSIRAITQKAFGEACVLKDLKVNGGQVVQTAVCSNHEITTTTDYHGDSYDSKSSTGGTVQAKRTGACK